MPTQEKRLIPNDSQTVSKRPDRYVNGVYPKKLVRGFGCHVFDENDDKYVDYISSLGAVILGYSHPSINRSVTAAIEDGEVLLPFSHPREVDLAKKLVEIIPCAEQVKYFKTGSEATSAAVRLARAYTGKDGVLVCGYHGWHDWYQITAPQNAGIPAVLGQYTHKCTYNDLDSFEKYLQCGRIACVILEPVVYDAPENNFLDRLIALAHLYGALVIFDEMVTCFRFGLGGASEYFQSIPDLACIGKSMANGFPMAALVGKSEFMSVYERDDFFVSGTFGGDVVGITAAIATIDCMQRNKIDLIGEGSHLKTGFNQIASSMNIPVKCKGFAPRTFFEFPSIEHKAIFWQECVKRGVLFGYANFVTSAHSYGTIESTLDVCERSLKVVKDNWKSPKDALEGDVPVEMVLR